MSDAVVLTGMVLSAVAAGEYDRRLVLLTRERGKITAFARGARRQGSTLLAASRPFAFGQFTVYEGRSAYTMQSAQIDHYFAEFGSDLEGMAYGCYFLELAGYFSRENVDGAQMLNLLYLSLKALQKPALPNPLVRRIYELRTLVVQGEYPETFQCPGCGKDLTEGQYIPERDAVFCRECLNGKKIGYDLSPAGLYAIQYIIGAPLEKLYTFTLKKDVFQQAERAVQACLKRYVRQEFPSLTVLDAITT